MKLTFIGAAHEVTGSCHLLEVNNTYILIDCGMEQGPDIYENQEIPIPVNSIDYVLLTHAHIDHSGLLPLLVKQGFHGEIITTFATQDLCNIMLRDSAHIQEFEAEWKNRKAQRAGRPLVEPLYTTTDAINALFLFSPCSYNQRINIAEGVDVRFTDVGHLLGSAAIEVWLKEGDIEKKIVFSGDIGNSNKPILKDPTYISDTDYLVIESTYGDRLHDLTRPDYMGDFTRIMKETFALGGNVVIPSFAVGRTQEFLYLIREIKEKNLISEFPNFEVYVDSPLAIEATTIFNKNGRECFDEEAFSLIEQGINPLVFPGLNLSTTSEESKAINFNSNPKVILSASGMCEAGRIRHHLKHNLWRAESTILFVGYQAQGTLGRKLMEGVDTVTLFGETVEVRARIENLKGVSGHADQKGLLDYIGGFTSTIDHVFVVHGDDQVADHFADLITNRFGYSAFAPFSGGIVDLATNTIVMEGIPLRKQSTSKANISRATNAHQRLINAGKYLMQVILKLKGRPNKDLAKLESQIQQLAQKWDD